ncbi:MAG: hypothetical protein ACOCYV_03475 [Planctomycetota bacterium]
MNLPVLSEQGSSSAGLPAMSHDAGANSAAGTNDLHHESAVQFLVNHGLDRQHVTALPPVVVTSIGSLLNQGDTHAREIRRLTRQLKEAEMTVNRLRAQRNAMRSHLKIIGALKE